MTPMREFPATARRILPRSETTACESLCLFTCLSQKTIKDKVKMGLTLLKGDRGKKRRSKTVALPIVT